MRAAGEQSNSIVHEDAGRDAGARPAGALDEPMQLLLRDLLNRQPLLAAINSVLAVLTAVLLVGAVPVPWALGWLVLMLRPIACQYS